MCRARVRFLLGDARPSASTSCAVQPSRSTEGQRPAACHRVGHRDSARGALGTCLLGDTARRPGRYVGAHV